MENVADALKIAAAVLLFVIALSVAMLSLSQARAASEAIIYTKDQSNYYSYIDEDQYVTANNKFRTSRTVGIEDIIPTLYRYNIEEYRVEFYHKDGRKLKLYDVTETSNTLKWRQEHSSDPDAKNINYLDLDDETKRNEPWQISNAKIKQYVDMIIYGPTIQIERPTGGPMIRQSDAPLMKYKGKTFKEEVGIFTYVNEDLGETNDELEAIQDRKQTKRVIRYTLMD